MRAIECIDVCYTYPGEQAQVALSNVSFSIAEGSFVVLLGANGCGKSTLAKMLNGLLTPTEGKVTVFGEDTATEDNATIFGIRSTVGEVFQNPDNQMVASIIEDDVAFGPENLGVPREEIVERVEWALRSVGMLAYRGHTPTKLSGGQKQRVAIAGVLAMRPRVLVLDESTAMLDPQGRKEVMEVLHRLHKEEGLTVLHITHHMDECIDADRALVMDEGRILFDGTPAELFADSALVKRARLELPPVALIAHKLHNNGLSIDAGICYVDKLVDAISKLR